MSTRAGKLGAFERDRTDLGGIGRTPMRRSRGNLRIPRAVTSDLPIRRSSMSKDIYQQCRPSISRRHIFVVVKLKMTGLVQNRHCGAAQRYAALTAGFFSRSRKDPYSGR
jgi:hypothetical protein